MARTAATLAGALVMGLVGGIAGTRLAPALNQVPDHPAMGGKVTVSTPTGGAEGIADLVDHVSSAVVNIDTVAHQRAPEDPFQFFFGGRRAPAMREAKGIGSGFIIRSDGLAVTNYHVVNGADQLTVTLANGNKYPAKVVGTDPSTDLALVRFTAKDAPTLKLADPKSLRVGEYVVALGSPLGLQQTVTMGILSAINRSIGINVHVSFLQTDAPINPGNSGGPLLNLKGEVIGVNTAIAAQGQGIGFAIPVELLQTEIPQLEAHGQVEHAWLGVGVQNLPEDKSQMFYPAEYGIVVGRVEPRSPAARAGLKTGDILMELNGKHLTDSSQLVQEVGKLPVGSQVELKVSRSGQQQSFKVTLDRMPKEAMQQQQQQGEDDQDDR